MTEKRILGYLNNRNVPMYPVAKAKENNEKQIAVIVILLVYFFARATFLTSKDIFFSIFEFLFIVLLPFILLSLDFIFTNNYIITQLT